MIQGTNQTDRKIKPQSLSMCNCSAMGTKASVLTEVGFMTNEREADLMKTAAFCKEQGEDVARVHMLVMYSDEIDKHKIEKAFSGPLTEDEAIDILRVAIYEPFGNGLTERLKEFFAKIGLYCNLSGYNYLMTAVEEVGKDNTLIKKLTRGLYPLVGSKYGTSGSIVERSIRNAINNTYNSGKLREVINGQYGGNLAEYEKPTNGEMIAFLYQMVR